MGMAIGTYCVGHGQRHTYGLGKTFLPFSPLGTTNRALQAMKL
jgi:hypothetical protein